MLRISLLNKSSIRKLSSIYDKNNYKKYFNNFKKIDLDLVLWNYCIGGGLAGGAYSSYLTYKSVRDTSSYTVCVAETSIMGLYGFVLGFSFFFNFTYFDSSCRSYFYF